MTAQMSNAKQQLLAKMRRGGVVGGSSTHTREMQRRASGAEVPLSYGQQQIWLHAQFSADSLIYNEPVTIHRTGSLDVKVLERSFTEIVRRHEAWRTTFHWKNGNLIQVTEAAPSKIEIPVVDLSGIPWALAQETANDLATTDALMPFDLERGPMYRPRLVRFSQTYSRLYLCLHHIIFDGVSLYGVFLPELQTLYEAFSSGRPSPLEELKLQYGDYAVWQREWVDSVTPAQMAYWRKKLQSLPTRDLLPPQRGRGPVQTYRGAMETLALSAVETNALKDVSRDARVTLFGTLLGSFQALLWVYTRQTDMILGSSSAGRNRSETETMLGYFLNVLVLRTDLSGDPTFLELTRRGFEELLNTLAHDSIPFETLVKEICPKHDGTKNPLFQVLISFEPPLAPLHDGWGFTQMDVETNLAKFDLHLELDEREDGIIGRFVYNSDLFDKSTIVRMMDTWRRILASVIEDPHRRLSQLESLLPVGESVAAQLTNKWLEGPAVTDDSRMPGKRRVKGFVRQLLGAVAERRS